MTLRVSAQASIHVHCHVKEQHHMLMVRKLDMLLGTKDRVCDNHGPLHFARQLFASLLPVKNLC